MNEGIQAIEIYRPQKMQRILRQLAGCILYSVIFLSIFSCKNPSDKQTNDSMSSLPTSRDEVKYAKGFSLTYEDNYKIININHPWKGENERTQYILYQKDTPQLNSNSVIGGNTKAKLVKIPIKSIVCISTTHLAFIEFIDETETIKGIADKKYVYSQKINKLIQEGKIIDVGIEQNLNIEAILELKPDIVMVYGVKGVSVHNYRKLEEQGLTVVYCAEYLEETPLGKAEWVKFFSVFYNKEQLANEKFEQIAAQYNKYKSLVRDVKNKPTVLVNMALEGLWFMPAESSFMSQFFNDAGATLCLAPSGAKSSLSFGLETVLDKCVNADFWLNTGTANLLKEIINSDKRYANFFAFKKGNVYNNNNRMNAYGGNDYWESGVVEPNIILKDLIKIFHPEIAPEHKLYYYKKLE